MNEQCESSSVEKTNLSQENKNEDIMNMMMDENDNFITDSCLQSHHMFGEKMEERSAGNSASDLEPEMKSLQISDNTKFADSKQLAGYVRSVILASGTVVIGLAPGGKILDIGTAIFALTDKEAPREIGLISDIFGSVYEHMYSLQLRESVVDANFLQINAKVYYLRDHPSTGFIRVKHKDNGRLVIVRSRKNL